MKAVTMGLCLAAACLCASGCDNRLEANKQLVLRAHEELWNGGNLDVVDEIYSPEYIAHWAYGEDSDRDGIKAMVSEARTLFPDMTEEIVHLVAEGDLVVSHFISSGTFEGEMNGLHPSGAKVSRPEIALHRIVDGRIVEQWTVSDQLTLMKQLGLM